MNFRRSDNSVVALFKCDARIIREMLDGAQKAAPKQKDARCIEAACAFLMRGEMFLGEEVV